MKYKVITLCGSTRFKDDFIRIQRKLTIAGNIVISVGVFGHAESEIITDKQKQMLDDIHKEKIKMSDAIYVGTGGMVTVKAPFIDKHKYEIIRIGKDLGVPFELTYGCYEGNEKSKRVQEKLGFKHQWVSENVPVPQMGETRTGHVNLMTREDWEAGR